MIEQVPISLRRTRGMCRACRSIIDSEIIIRDGGVYQRSLCPKCGPTESPLAESEKWYREVIEKQIHNPQPVAKQTATVSGCPFDCGLCQRHLSGPNLPVFSITNACNLNCPICFTYNRKDRLYYMSAEEMRKTVNFLLEQREYYDLINITGGEPTLHPQLEDLLGVAVHENIGRITMNSNGLRMAEDERLVEMLGELNVYVILSFDTLDGETSIRIHGTDLVDRKLKALDRLARHDIGVTLLNVMIGGVNDHEIYDIIALSEKYPNIRSVTVQNMTFTGQGGGSFFPRNRLTLDGAMRIIEEKSDRKIRHEHFFPLPATHPLCYSVAYYFKDSGRLGSFTEIVSKKILSDLLGSDYILHPDEKFLEEFNRGLTESWALDKNPEMLAFIKNLFRQLYPRDRRLTPFERQRIAESSILTVYIHAHMDEDNFDLERIKHCTDLVPVDGERLIPACAYNLFYRMDDERFWTG